MIYTLTLNPAVDYHLAVGPLSCGTTNLAGAPSVHFGGKGINVSLLLRELGVESIALGFAAGFTGDALEAHLRSVGLRTDLIRLPDGMTRINVKLHGADGETEINAPGPTVPRACMDALMEKLVRLGEGDTLVMSGSLPGGLPSDTYASIAEAVVAHGVRVVADTTRDALRAVLPYGPFLIKPNLSELEAVVGRSLRAPDGSPDRSLVAEAARELQDAGARNVLVTLGGDGALLLAADGQCHTQAAPAGEVVDTVGAGDSTVAGFLAATDRGMAPADALRLAVAAGTATALSSGLGTRETIERVWTAMNG